MMLFDDGGNIGLEPGTFRSSLIMLCWVVPGGMDMWG